MNKTFEVYSQEEIDKWVLRMYNTYVYDSANYIVWAITNCNYRYTICCNLKTGNTGKSKRHPNDEYDARVGIAYAYARMENLPEPKLVEKIYRLDECVGKVICMRNHRYYVVGTSEDKTYCILKNKNNGCLYEYESDIKIRTSNIKE